MSTLEATVEELKSLAPTELAKAAGYIHKLKVADSHDGRLALERAFGCLTPTEAEDMKRAIEENCERTDASQSAASMTLRLSPFGVFASSIALPKTGFSV